jgi:hypothetical protein
MLDKKLVLDLAEQVVVDLENKHYMEIPDEFCIQFAQSILKQCASIDFEAEVGFSSYTAEAVRELILNSFKLDKEALKEEVIRLVKQNKAQEAINILMEIRYA